MSEAANAAINSTEDFIRFFSQHSARPELTALLQQAYEKHTNSPVVKNEKLKALPPGTLDALIFVDMLTENAIPYNLDKYVKSLGHNTELLRQDKFFAGYLASYAADLLRKHKDIATVFAICTNGELDVQNAITCAGSTNFFEYKQFLDDNGANAELAWFYFARKNLHVDPAMVALEFETYDFIRNNEKESIRFGALSRRMEEILKKMRTRTSKYKELASTMQRDVDENITDIKRKLSETREMFEHHDSLNKTYTQYSEDPSFCQEHPAEAEEIRAFLPTIRTLVNYERAQFLWGTTICRAYERMKNLSTEELKAEKDKLIQMTRRQETYLNELGSKLEPDKIKVLTDNSDRLTETIRQYAERQK